MFSIFNKRKPNLNDEENEIEADIDISTTNTTHTSSITNQTLDLGNKDSGPCRLILTECKKIKFGTQQRAFRSQWYNKCDWLEYGVQRNTAFCFVCRTFGSENSLNSGEIYRLNLDSIIGISFL
ncbi:uncharacterized protein LOC112691765 [Sipha flava]|uniref:Uncharacterized protein LOC112691765 n=2 Tax=Sipha flava TaxID=143950 RepID=A0A8B8GH71_9HEMI|nr:uncharacterized protein LOC112691765 [Sipha flava]